MHRLTAECAENAEENVIESVSPYEFLRVLCYLPG